MTITNSKVVRSKKDGGALVPWGIFNAGVAYGNDGKHEDVESVRCLEGSAIERCQPPTGNDHQPRPIIHSILRAAVMQVRREFRNRTCVVIKIIH
jgi:hypothetical protein